VDYGFLTTCGAGTSVLEINPRCAAIFAIRADLRGVDMSSLS
jgi:hypothetical protein